ncbi:hypothetical protein [Zobellella taiwanensis]|uniref:hypothetical protein n=1 Tax=Zobellella taiwanensis TaxID=347535 RepID=UPI0015E64AD9|nr:hypothetical protein [Zobellella taiwanensis]
MFEQAETARHGNTSGARRFAPPNSLDQAVQGYADFDGGVAKKFVIDPHGMVAA